MAFAGRPSVAERHEDDLVAADGQGCTIARRFRERTRSDSQYEKACGDPARNHRNPSSSRILGHSGPPPKIAKHSAQEMQRCRKGWRPGLDVG